MLHEQPGDGSAQLGRDEAGPVFADVIAIHERGDCGRVCAWASDAFFFERLD